MRALLVMLLLASAAWAQQFRLYLKDGSWHVVREYQVVEDRVRYYSVERSEWEEVPLELADLKRTEQERRARIEEEKKQAEIADAEEAFEREIARQIARIPVEPGLYYFDGGEVREIRRAGLKSVASRKRTALKVLVPVPIVAGKAFLELPGANAATALAGERPELYFRIDWTAPFTLVRVKPKQKGEGRVVGILQTEPMTKMAFFEFETVDIFRQQLKADLFRIWPSKPLPPGEYALVQYSEGEATDSGEILVWDFRVVAAPTSR
ncbi:MAG: hypothetical protein N2036_11645 [Bryobacteraceae bacterium]|nr:hypothetical protein [Bryobacteraceae bacterium]MCX7604718.1 hypothetical protein [Bryobacteraceae bacterium]